jgi:hypothetical protein
MLDEMPITFLYEDILDRKSVRAQEEFPSEV